MVDAFFSDGWRAVFGDRAGARIEIEGAHFELVRRFSSDVVAHAHELFDSELHRLDIVVSVETA